MNGNNLCLTNRHQATEYGLRARRTAGNSSPYFFQSKVLRERKKVSRLFGGKDGYDFVDLLGALKLPERVNDNRDSAYLQELLWADAAQPSSLPGGDDDRDVHEMLIREFLNQS